MGFSKNGLPRTQRPIRLARTKGTWPHPHQSSPNKHRRRLESIFSSGPRRRERLSEKEEKEEREKRGKRGGKKKKNDVAGATEIDLFLFPRLGRRRERLRARLIISRPGRGRGDEKKRDEALGTIGAMGIDFSSWLRAETIKCAVDFSGDN